MKNLPYLRKKLKKKEIIKRLNCISFEDIFVQDKYYFLIGLKPVVRIESYGNVKERIRGLEGFPCIDNKGGYLFISYDINLAKRASELTTKLNKKKCNPSLSKKVNIELGMLYGYPGCCSESFQNNSHKFDEEYSSPLFDLIQGLPKFNVPFIPCSESCNGIKEFIKNAKMMAKKIGINKDIIHISSGKLKKLLLFLTKRCDLNCDYCFVHKKEEDMPLSTAISAVNHYISKSGNNEKVINFIGGEPLIRFDRIKKIIKYTRIRYPRFNVRYFLVTNGNLLDNEKINFIKKQNITLNISLDGIKRSQELHRKKSKHEKVTEKIKMCLNSGLNPGINMTISPKEAVNLMRNVMDISKLGVSYVSVVPALSIFWKEKEIMEWKKSLADLARWYFLKNTDMRITPLDGIIRNRDMKFDMCDLGRYLAVDCDGEYIPCQVCINMKKRFSVGSIDRGISKKLGTGKKICMIYDFNKGKKLDKISIVKNEEIEKSFFDVVSPFRKRLESLRAVNLKITERCNNSCRYCLVKKSNKKSSFEVIKKSLDETLGLSRNIRTVRISGGEPLIEIDLVVKVIDYVRKTLGRKDIKIILCTNGSLLNKDNINIFRRNDVSLEVSLDGNQICHNLYRGWNKKCSFFAVLNHISKLKAEMVDFVVVWTITPDSLQYIGDSFKLFGGAGINKCKLVPAFGAGWNKRKLNNLEKEFNKLRYEFGEAKLKNFEFVGLQNKLECSVVTVDVYGRYNICKNSDICDKSSISLGDVYDGFDIPKYIQICIKD